MYKRRLRGWSQHIDFMLLDILCAILSLFVAFLLIKKDGVLSSRFFWRMVVETSLVNLVVMIVLDTYHSVLHHSPWDEMVKLLAQTGYLIIILLVFELLNQSNDPDLSKIALIAVPLYVLTCFIVRQVYKNFLKKKHHIFNKHSMLIALESSQIPTVIPRILHSNYGSYRFSGIAIMGEDPSEDEARKALRELREEFPEVETIPIVATTDTLIQYLTNNWVDEVYLDVPPKTDLPVDLINSLMCMGITIHTALTHLDDIESRHKNVEWICGHLTITTSLGYITGRDLLLKRLMDIAGGLLGSLATLLLIPPIGLAIFLSDPGPIFFAQTHIGENGKKFQMYKFRSMYKNAEERKKQLAQETGQEDQLMFKMEHDPRIIGQKQRPDGTWKKGIGGWIRDLSIDEFPQFFNVLKGDMSLVGTRPPTVDEWHRYEPFHRARMSTRPGITGLWQVSGRSEIRDFDTVVRLDREYIENWSLKQDIHILFKTVYVVLLRRGAM
ncbi:MAG: exopolysaccharide biosynthesis polyprenyl glycosylphosphotransferase [Stomatobaculum sp.]|nr:exopolysaccharide biosynthesis polyprenyl glycosylphosphotransferase [Stomatobaculum sp.]